MWIVFMLPCTAAVFRSTLHLTQVHNSEIFCSIQSHAIVDISNIP